jgi:hypothetical protein
MLDLSSRSLQLARKTAQSGLDAAVTIAARTPGLLAPNIDFTGERAKEARLMVEEKVAAACEGIWAAQIAWVSFLVKAAFGGVTSPEHVSNAFVDVADAALAPARRTVSANARRLTGMKPLG